jgi:hypothetical protein
MNKINAFTIAAALSLVSLGAASETRPKPEQPATNEAAQKPSPRRPAPPATPTPPRAAPRPAQPPRATPPAHAKPRPPASARPRAQVDRRGYVYPYVPLYDFDFIYRFPYGVYPYWGDGYLYPYPYPPYEYALPDGTSEEIAVSGGVRIDIPQKNATVSADGYYVGQVEDFDGAAEHLSLASGPHHIQIRAPRFRTLDFDVFIQAGRIVSYRSAMASESDREEQ